MLLMSVGVLVLSLVLTPGAEVVRLGGWDVPVLCTSRRVFDVECLGCGMTRAFVFLAHLDLASAWSVNKLGLPMFLLVLGQIPYRAWRMWGSATPAVNASSV